MKVNKGNGCEDLDKAGKLQTMQFSGQPLEPEDQLWLEHWQALMNEVGQIQYKPTCMFLPDKKKIPDLQGPGDVPKEG
jgi:hypothetical protein